MNFPEFKKKFQKNNVEESPNQVTSIPFVSVIVQTYNHSGFISSCLDSILNQETTFTFEILIGEDDSQDNTRKICQEYAEKHPTKIRLFLHHRENQIKILGEATSNFNALYNFYSARGIYVAFCEGDDMWADPLKLQKQVDFLEINSNFSFTFHSFITVDTKDHSIDSIENTLQPKKDLSKQDLLKNKYHPLLLCVCFRNVFNTLPKELAEVINVDTFLFSYLGQYGEAKFLNNITPSKYRKHNGGIWSHRKKEKKYLSKIVTYQKLMEYNNRIDDVLIGEFYSSKLQSTYKSLILLELKNAKPINAFKYSLKLLGL